MDQLTRRQFLEFIGRTGVVAAIAPTVGCSTLVKPSLESTFTRLAPTKADDLVLAKGFSYSVLLKSNENISADSAQKFGSNCDFNAFIPLDSSNPVEGYLWTNHEDVNSLLHLGYVDKPGSKKPKEIVSAEMDAVGGSIVRMLKDEGIWKVDKTHPFNRRITAKTPLKFSALRQIDGSNTALGTLGNCAGGVTPWGTVLTCEENFMHFYGDFKSSADKTKVFHEKEDMGWAQYYPRSPMHYGWVVEINPATGEGKKLVALGRFSHEGATCVKAADGRTVVYMGDDANDQCIYKFISDKPNSLETGTLFVASLENKRWMPLVLSAHPKLAEMFYDQTELLCFAREAAKVVGGTPLDRPEDIKQDPITKDIFIALTNNIPKGRPHGSILKISESGSNPLSMEFDYKTWMMGGLESGLSCPDNLAFDKGGNLWITTDRSFNPALKEAYKNFGNNALLFIPMSGPHAGTPIQVASAPMGAEFTGPCFLPNSEALILSVQHPGEDTKDLANLTSDWPDRGKKVPRSSVVLISGPQFLKCVNT